MHLSKLHSMFIGGLLLGPVSAQLSSMNEQPWIGHFVGYERRDFTFCVKDDAKMVLWPNRGRKDSVAFYKTIQITAEVTQVANGKVQTRSVVPVTLSSQNEPTQEPTSIKFSGKVTGDAQFEVMLEFEDDQVFLGGRLLHQGRLSNPRFQIRVKFGDLYRFFSDKELERQAKRDRIEFVRLDGKKEKVGVLENVDLGGDDMTGIGLKSVEIDLPPYEGRSFLFETKGAGKILLENPRRMASPAKDGFSILWQADPDKDPQAEGRLSIAVK